jgi:hypothetical protein
VEGAFGAVGLVAGTFDGQFRATDRTLTARRDLVGGGQRQRDLVGVHRGQ